MQTQSIIVYRSQSEKAFDEMLMSGDMIPIAGAVLVFLFACVFFDNHLSKYMLKFMKPWTVSKHKPTVMFILSGICAFATFKYLVI